MNNSVPILQGILNILKFLNENWTYIVAIIALIYALYRKIINFINKSKEEQKKDIEEAQRKLVDAALIIISETMAEKVSKAELDWSEYKKSGTIKRAKVISEIYEQFPVLKEYIDQGYIIHVIDELIDEALKETTKILNAK